ncbi:MAG: hypothetical protein AAFZ01_13055 [Pseudomonadota bacterium]
MTMIRAAAIASAFAFFASAAQAQQGPSFSCSAASNAAERTICRFDNLSQLDRRMARLYDDARDAARSNRARRDLRDEQRDWVRDRNDCRNDRRCLRDKYRDRIAELRDGGSSEPTRRTAAYQQTRAWKDRCDGRLSVHLETTCYSPRLWRLYRDIVISYQDIRRTAPVNVSKRAQDEQRDWNVEWAACKRNERCHERKMENRLQRLRRMASRAGERTNTASSGVGYQRTRAWKDRCSGQLSVHLETTCNSPRLWSLYTDIVTRYRALRRNSPPRVAARVQDDQQAWNREWAACGDRRGCQRRKMEARLDEMATRYNRRSDARDSGNRSRGRGEVWQYLCSRYRDEAHQTACNDRALWKLRREVFEAYVAASQRAPRIRDKRFLTEQDSKWKRSFAACDQRKRCMRRSMRERITYLDSIYGGDPGRNRRTLRDIADALRTYRQYSQ